jgi:hypothetical protein
MFQQLHDIKEIKIVDQTGKTGEIAKKKARWSEHHPAPKIVRRATPRRRKEHKRKGSTMSTPFFVPIPDC